MHVYRGRAETIAADRTVSERLVDRVADERVPAVRVWRPHRQVAFGRRDQRADGYERARGICESRGFPPVERSVGGRAVAYTGTTVAFGRAVPIEDPRSGLQNRYDKAVADIQAALETLGVDATEGEPPNSFCPGTHSLQITSVDSQGTSEDRAAPRGKLAGIAQRVRKRAALVAGVLIVADHRAIANVLEPVYEELDVAFDPDSLGSVALAGGETDPETVVSTVESALVGDREISVERVETASN